MRCPGIPEGFGYEVQRRFRSLDFPPVEQIQACLRCPVVKNFPMPSDSRKKFRHVQMLDVQRLLELHDRDFAGTRGRKAGGHLTRSALVVLCAAFQSYMQEVVLESVAFLARNCSGPKELPTAARKAVVRGAKDLEKKSKNDLSLLELAGDGWRQMYEKRAEWCVERFSTPSSGNVNALFSEILGVSKISSLWPDNIPVRVDDMLETRHAIVHEGPASGYPRRKGTDQYVSDVANAVLATDNGLSDCIKKVTPNSLRPWNRQKFNLGS